MPPPRFVRRSSTSELRNVSVFSAKLGPDSTPCGENFRCGNGRRRCRENRQRRCWRSLSMRRSHWTGFGRDLFCQVKFPNNKSNYAKADNNPCSSIHKFGFARSDAMTDVILTSAYPAQRHRIVPTSTPRLTARQALESQPASAADAMRLHRFQKIGRTGRRKSAAAIRTAEQTK